MFREGEGGGDDGVAFGNGGSADGASAAAGTQGAFHLQRRLCHAGGEVARGDLQGEEAGGREGCALVGVLKGWLVLRQGGEIVRGAYLAWYGRGAATLQQGYIRVPGTVQTLVQPGGTCAAASSS